MNKCKIWIITMFPEIIKPFLENGVIGKVIQGERGQIGFDITLLQLRDFSPDGFKGIDDSPYGGGPGMVMRADVLINALEKGILNQYGYNKETLREKFHVIFTDPRGKTWNHLTALAFVNEKILNTDESHHKDLIFVCGRYEGVDERFLQKYVTEIYSIGDYVLSGGELAVMAILDSAIRHLPGSLGNVQGAIKESFVELLLEEPQYTRPSNFEGIGVPEILMSGNHKLIEEYRLDERIKMTQRNRPDLFQKYKAAKKVKGEQ